MENKYYYDKLSNLLFMYDENTDTYFPFMYEYDIVSGEGKLFLDNSLFVELFEYVNYVRRRPDKRTGDLFSIPLFVYQWVGLYLMIVGTLNKQSIKYLFEWSRQCGKSEIIKIFMGFAPVFLPEYMDIPLERFYTVLGSYKEESVKKLSGEVKPYIYKAIEFYNENRTDRLLTKTNDSKLVDSIFEMEINKLFSGRKKSIPYSHYRAITCGATQDGLSAHALVIDEAGLIDASLYETSVSPFLTATGGGEFVFGVPNQNSTSLFISKQKSIEVINYLLEWKDVVKLRYLTNKEMAVYYKNVVVSKIRELGEHAPFVQWNYYLNSQSTNGKFMTDKVLEELNILTEHIIYSEDVIHFKNNPSEYVVAGFDTSVKHDYKSLTIGCTTVMNHEYSTYVLNMFTFNQNRTDRMTVDKLAEEVLKKCIEYKVDVFCYDSTAIGFVFAQSFIKYMKQYKVIMSLCPIVYNEMMKSKMFSYLENSMYSGKIKLLEKASCWESKKLYEELLTFEKKVSTKNSSVVKYSAPSSENCSDDHMNSLALFNIGLRELTEKLNSTNKKDKVFDDGYNQFKLFLTKFKDMNEIKKIDINSYKKELQREINEIGTWCPVLV